MNKKNVFLSLGLAIIGLVTAPAMAANLLLNPGFEEGYSTYWTRNAGTLDGTGLGEDPHSGSKSWHGAWNNAGSAQTTTYYQDVPVLPGAVCNASMWCKANAWNGIYGNDTHSFRLRIRFRDAAGNNIETWDATSAPDDTWQQPSITNKTAPAGTVACRILFSYITTAPANAWKVWNIDDLVFDAGNAGDQPVVFGMTPNLAPNNLSDTSATVTGVRLTGATAVKLVQGATQLVGYGVSIAPDGKSLTVTFPTTGAPYGYYQVVVEKTGYAPTFLDSALKIRDPSQSYLVNGDFEAGAASDSQPITGWTRWFSTWGGTPAIDRCFVAGASDMFIHVPKYGDPPVDTPVFGNYSFRSGEWNQTGGEGGIIQQVPVFPGENVVLSFKWGGGLNATPAAVEIGVLKGAYTTAWNYNGADSLGMVRRETGGQWGWEERSVSFTVPAGTTTVSVYTKIWLNTGQYQAFALWVDDMTLSSPSCPNQHTLTGSSPVAIDAYGEFDLTITGTNLDQVSVVRITRGQDQLEAESFTSHGGGTSLVAHFVPPANGMTPGDYNVVTEQSGCLGKALADALEIGCLPVGFTGLSETTLEKPQTQVELTVTGQNLDKLTSIMLYQPVITTAGGAPPVQPQMAEVHRTIPGTVVNNTNPSAIVVQFDFSNKAHGTYELRGTRVGVCGNPAALPSALTLELPPESKIIPLDNADFELGPTDPSWVMAGDNLIRGPYPPGEYFGFVPYGGEYFAAKAINGGDGTFTMSQDLGLPSGPGEYNLVLAFQTLIWSPMFRAPSTVTASIIADEGLPTELISSTVTESDPDWPWPTDWTMATVEFKGNVTTGLQIKYDLYVNSDGGWANVAIDNLVLYSGVAACSNPFADADKDGDVDQADFAIIQACYTGTGGTVSDECRCFDRKDTPGSLPDGDVDQTDMAAFEACASGPGIPADPTCDDDN